MIGQAKEVRQPPGIDPHEPGGTQDQQVRLIEFLRHSSEVLEHFSLVAARVFQTAIKVRHFGVDAAHRTPGESSELGGRSRHEVTVHAPKPLPVYDSHRRKHKERLNWKIGLLTWLGLSQKDRMELLKSR